MVQQESDRNEDADIPGHANGEKHNQHEDIQNVAARGQTVNKKKRGNRNKPDRCVC
jgi:hypothetical protein